MGHGGGQLTNGRSASSLPHQVRKQNSPTVDLLTTTFGSPPNLAPVLGSYGAVDKLKLYSKDRKRA